MLTVYFATKMLRLIVAVETTFADMSSQINTRLKAVPDLI